MAQKLKTADYTRRASKNYRDKHSYWNITFDRGEVDLMREAGITTDMIRDMVRAEYERRTAKKDD